MSCIGNVYITPNPLGIDVRWRIPDFFSFPENGNWYNSPVFSFDGIVWNFSISPNGTYKESTGNVDISIYQRFNSPSATLELSLALLTVNGEKCLETHCTHVFSEYNPFYDFTRFVSKWELSKRRSELVPNDILTIQCRMKRPVSDRNATEKKLQENSENAYVDAFTQTEAETGERKLHENSENAYVDVFTQTEEETDETKQLSSAYANKVDPLESIQSDETEVYSSNQTCASNAEEFDDSSLGQDFKNVLLEGLDHDLILKIGDKELRAHRDVLRARSQVFKSMLTHDMIEKNSGIIKIDDCEADAMEQFLFYIYSGKVENLNESNMLGLYYVADKYNIKDLKRQCSDYIKKSLSQTNICDAIQLALNHSDSSLLEFATGYFMGNAIEIMRTAEWQIFMKENSTVANELIIKSFEKINNTKI